eukprot:GEMP01042595.1.p1 GENE.GEMP01042595.1~~GEMP01042595.1.p1  ORF type:complete len:443 (-),score=104.35 GEMP01042595.1:461-1789(-)
MLSVLALIAGAAADRWAVIAAGSAGYGNYRHQADACHAYKILVRNGVSPDKIILMMAGDVPFSLENPFYSELFNHPGNETIPDVFKDCNASYLGQPVTKDLFLAILTGDEEKARTLAHKQDVRVLKSGPNDTVFINFVDHGGVGIIAFPFGPVLEASELYKALGFMHEKNMYKQVLFYMEACESGSMFIHEELIPAGVLALTAANMTSSYASYCPPFDVVHGVELETCLGDLFSVNWMEDSDSKHKGETIQEQFDLVAKETTMSTVCAWGDKSILQESLSTFIGSPATGYLRTPAKKTKNGETQVLGLVRSRDVSLHLAYYRFLRASEKEKDARMKDLQAEEHRREVAKTRFEKIVKLACGEDVHCKLHALGTDEVGRFDLQCHHALVQKANSCGWDEYAMAYSRVLAHLCGLKPDGVVSLQNAVESVCGNARDANSQEIYA